MAHPVEVLAAARARSPPGGAVLLVDERVAEAFTAPGDEVERIMYGWSVTHCLPAVDGRAAVGGARHRAAPGHRARARGRGRLRARSRSSPVENDFFRLYRLDA